MEQLIVGKSLEMQLAALLDTLPSDAIVSYMVTRLNEGEEATIVASSKETIVHTGASMVKTLILEYVFHLAAQEQLDLNDTIALSRSPRVEGAGALMELVGNHSFSYLERCRLMMVLSDNWATNLLMDFTAVKENRENYITAMDMAVLLHHIYELRHTIYGHEMWNILGRQQFRDILPFHWGEDVIFHHKTGSLDCVEHDAGIIETMNGDFCFVLLMSHLDNDKAKQLGAQMGLIMKEFVEDALP